MHAHARDLFVSRIRWIERSVWKPPYSNSWVRDSVLVDKANFSQAKNENRTLVLGIIALEVRSIIYKSCDQLNHSTRNGKRLNSSMRERIHIVLCCGGITNVYSLRLLLHQCEPHRFTERFEYPLQDARNGRITSIVNARRSGCGHGTYI